MENTRQKSGAQIQKKETNGYRPGKTPKNVTNSPSGAAANGDAVLARSVYAADS